MSRIGTYINPFRVLLVEDNPGDADLMREAFSRVEAKIDVQVALDGEEGLDYLRKMNAFTAALTPDLIILDLNLPKMDGRELLAVLKTNEHLNHIPVVVFSSSSAERDTQDVYRLHGNCFMTKPVELKDFFAIAADISRFWFGAVKLPARQ